MAMVCAGEDRSEKTRSEELEVKQFEALGRRVSPYVYYGLLLLVVALFALIRFRLREIPLERDEGEYAYAGQLMLQGIPPYQLAYTMKLPGTFAAYAAMIKIFGETPADIHIALILVNAATTFGVFLLGRRLFGGLAGIVAGASYALFSTSPLVLGFAGHATHFVVLFAIAGILLLLKALESNKTWLFFGSGLLLGLAFLMKQPGLSFLLFAGLYVIQRKLIPPVNWKDLVASAGSLAIGGALPFVITCLLILRAGLFQKFWFWTFLYAREYGSSRKLTDAVAHLLGQTALDAIGRVATLLLFAALLLVTYLWSARARSQGFFTISFFLFSFLAVCPGFYFRSHYFILILPAVSILVGMIVSCSTEKLLAWRKSFALGAVPLLLFLLAFAGAIFQQKEFLFQMDPLEACHDMYGRNPFPEALEIASYIKSHTPEGATIAVVGSEPEIYFYSHRHSATGYIYAYPLLEPQKYALDMQKEMMAEIEAARPEMLVFVNVSGSWVASLRPSSRKDILSWMQQYVQEHYVLDGIVDIGNVTQYRWGEEAQSYQPRSQNYVFVYRIPRKA
jgi:hypothetical protein